MTTKPWSLQESFQSAWGKLLIDFREWFIPDTEDGEAWKTKPINQAITATKGRMVDEAEKMLEMWRQNQVDDKDGSSAYLPVMITAFEAGGSIPELSYLRSMPTPAEVIIGADDQGRILKMRTIAMGIHAQIAIFTPNPHSALSIATQFVAYLSGDQKRRVPLTFDLGYGLVDQWDMTIFDNNIYPSRIPTEAENISIVTVDVILSGLVPQLIRGQDPASLVIEARLQDPPQTNKLIFPDIDSDQDEIYAIPINIGALFECAGAWNLPAGTWTASCSYAITNALPPITGQMPVVFGDGTSSVTVVTGDVDGIEFYISAQTEVTALWVRGVYDCQLAFTNSNGDVVNPPAFLIEVFLP